MNPRLGSQLYDFCTGRDTNVPTFSTFTTLDLTTLTTLPTLAHDSLTTFDFTTFRLTTLEQAERRGQKGTGRGTRTEGTETKPPLLGAPPPDPLTVHRLTRPPDPLTRYSRSRRIENRATGRQADRDSRRQPRPLGRINSRRNAAGVHLHHLRGRMEYLQIAVYTIKARRCVLRAFSCLQYSLTFEPSKSV